MVDFDIARVTGLGEYDIKDEIHDKKERRLYMVGERAFLVLNKNTLEVRCDKQLSEVLRERYESVMESRYFGRGGIEIVDSHQLSDEEIDDLVRLSYNLTIS